MKIPNSDSKFVVAWFTTNLDVDWTMSTELNIMKEGITDFLCKLELVEWESFRGTVDSAFKEAVAISMLGQVGCVNSHVYVHVAYFIVVYPM